MPRKDGRYSGEKKPGPTRFLAKQRTEAVLRLLRGEDIGTVSQDLGVDEDKLFEWRETFLATGTKELKKQIAKELVMAKWPVFSDKIKEDLLKTSKIALENSASMLDDARLLFDSGRFPRAASLAILAEEEASKARFLNYHAEHEQWDKADYDTLLNHGIKQAASRTTQKLLDFQKRQNNRFAPSLIPIYFKPSKSELDQLDSQVERINKQLVEKKRLDKFKQNCQFVALDKSGRCTSKPLDITEKCSGKCITMATRALEFARMVCTKIENQRFMRCSSKLSGDINQYQFTLEHEEGFDIVFSVAKEDFAPENLTSFKNRCLQFFNHHAHPQSEENRLMFKKLIQRHGVIEQAEKGAREIGCRSSEFADICRTLIAG